MSQKDPHFRKEPFASNFDLLANIRITEFYGVDPAGEETLLQSLGADLEQKFFLLLREVANTCSWSCADLEVSKQLLGAHFLQCITFVLQRRLVYWLHQQSFPSDWRCSAARAICTEALFNLDDDAMVRHLSEEASREQIELSVQHNLHHLFELTVGRGKRHANGDHVRNGAAAASGSSDSWMHSAPTKQALEIAKECLMELRYAFDCACRAYSGAYDLNPYLPPDDYEKPCCMLLYPAVCLPAICDESDDVAVPRLPSSFSSAATAPLLEKALPHKTQPRQENQHRRNMTIWRIDNDICSQFVHEEGLLAAVCKVLDMRPSTVGGAVRPFLINMDQTLAPGDVLDTIARQKQFDAGATAWWSIFKDKDRFVLGKDKLRVRSHFYMFCLVDAGDGGEALCIEPSSIRAAYFVTLQWGMGISSRPLTPSFMISTQPHLLTGFRHGLEGFFKEHVHANDKKDPEALHAAQQKQVPKVCDPHCASREGGRVLSVSA